MYVVATKRIVGIPVAFHIERHIVEVLVDVLLTSLTPSHTELQVVEPLHVLHERLVVDLPCKGCRWEVSPFLSLGEA